jgi:hypothetical protein
MLWCYDAAMSRMTLSLPDELHRALKEAAAVRGKTIGDLVAESVVAYGIKPRLQAERLVARARAKAALPEARALELATRETWATRRRRGARRS